MPSEIPTTALLVLALLISWPIERQRTCHADTVYGDVGATVSKDWKPRTDGRRYTEDMPR